MTVTVSHFDTLQNGQAIRKITLSNSKNTEVSILTLGAAIQAFCFAGKDLVLGFDQAEHYFHSGAYIGATVGRICNRTADGQFVLNGTTYQLACNEPDRRVHLHGGQVGFDKKVWDYTILREGAMPCVAFSAVSPDGEEGYPGTVLLQVTYTLTENDELILDYKAQSDADTPLNLTNHAYFNLNGCDGATVHNNLLQVNAEEYTPVTERLVPTGDYACVADTAIDFRAAKPIGEALEHEDDTMAYTGGVDHNFVLARTRPEQAVEAAYAYSPATGIELRCTTDLPGIQVYTGNFLDEPGGKYGLKWGKHQGFCLETQFFANSINQPNFPSIVLKAGDTFYSRTTYAVSLKGEG